MSAMVMNEYGSDPRCKICKKGFTTGDQIYEVLDNPIHILKSGDPDYNIEPNTWVTYMEYFNNFVAHTECLDKLLPQEETTEVMVEDQITPLQAKELRELFGPCTRLYECDDVNSIMETHKGSYIRDVAWFEYDIQTVQCDRALTFSDSDKERLETREFLNALKERITQKYGERID